ncbi:ribose utilization transcriptional repressor RbsR [Paucilactobacillus kaifaensis]|uniref:ribose utilization transcriptional repressor RbsR n=1 Tax=Paucilactobacillus kaifaensis TaxID=2559921 RepID=UPI0010F991D5|nr:LacI family DNA-binding transcriptional regulator [Paucilactobacillus kaifaensis]
MIKKTTIRDLAQAAGVSVTTVSQILNGKGQRFSSETRLHVLKLQKELNYVPDFNARNLILKSSQSIGVLVPNIGNPFFSTFIKGIQTTARELQYIPLIFGANHDEKIESYYLEKMIERATGGLIIASASITTETIDTTLKKNGIPYLLMDQNPIVDGDRVQTNDFDGGKLAAEHLLSLGHQQFAITMPSEPTANLLRRVAGFKQVLASKGLVFEQVVTIVYAPMTKAGGYEATREVLASGATAVFAINDEMAIGLYRGLRQQGILIPTDISVIGYDNIDLDEYVEPMLTTIQQPILEMGSMATRLLVNRIKEPLIAPQVVDLPVELIQRQSTGVPKIN